MRTLDKLLLYLFNLMVLVAAAAAAVLPFRVVSDRELVGIAESINGNYIITAVGVVVFLIALKPILFRSRKRKAKEIVSPMKGGDLRISDEAVRGITESAISKVNGLREPKVDVDFGDEGIKLGIKGAATPDVNIPEIAEQIQDTVIETVQNSTGMNVEKVNIDISNFSAGVMRASRQ